MKKNNRTHMMASFLLLAFAVFFLFVLGRFVYIQAKGEINNVSLKKWAQEKREVTETLPAERGKIFDNTGKLLAYDRSLYRLYAIIDEDYSQNEKEPKHVVNEQDVAKKLAPFLDVSEQGIVQRINDAKKNEQFQVEFGKAGKHIPKQVKNEIERLNIPGVYFFEEPVRYYPNGMFASHVIGTTENHDDEKIVGTTGIEGVKNDLLSGKDGYITYERDRFDKKLLNADQHIKKAQDGHDIYLTIDQKIQILLEDVLSEVDEKYRPERVSVVVMNPKTGEVLAMSNRPSYDPNAPGEVENWYNDIISAPFEPGSTVKMFTWAAAIDSNSYNGQEYFQSGRYRIHEKVSPVNDHNGGKGWGTITYDEGFLRSSNVAASRLVWDKIGPDEFYDYLQAFHFDQKTGIDLPNEMAGQILYNYPLEKLTSSFGQGGTLTPIQQMKAATAIANKGKMMKPYVIQKVVDPNSGKIVEETTPEVVGEPISAEAADQVLDLLHKVVNDDRGTGAPYRLKNYSVAGKTGTAEIPNPDGPGYLTGHGNSIYSFLGMAPKDDPQIMMHVSVKQPDISYTEAGSDVVSYIFNSVMENSLRYLNIEPDYEAENERVESVTLPTLVDKSTKEVTEILEKQGFKFTVVGEGKKVQAVNIAEDEAVFTDQHIIVVTDKPVMPDIKGWSKRDVFQLGDFFELDVVVEGSGYVIEQDIEAGKSFKNEKSLTVKFASKKNEKK